MALPINPNSRLHNLAVPADDRERRRIKLSSAQADAASGGRYSGPILRFIRCIVYSIPRTDRLNAPERRQLYIYARVHGVTGCADRSSELMRSAPRRICRRVLCLDARGEEDLFFDGARSVRCGDLLTSAMWILVTLMECCFFFWVRGGAVGMNLWGWRGVWLGIGKSWRGCLREEVINLDLRVVALYTTNCIWIKRCWSFWISGLENAPIKVSSKTMSPHIDASDQTRPVSTCERRVSLLSSYRTWYSTTVVWVHQDEIRKIRLCVSIDNKKASSNPSFLANFAQL